MESKDWIQIISIFISPWLALMANDQVHQRKEERELLNKKESLRLNTIKEIEFNISILCDLEKQHNKLKEYFSNNLWSRCFEYFRFTRVLFLSFNKLISDGFLYEFLDNQSILQLDELIGKYSMQVEAWCNEEVQRYKTLLSESPNDEKIKNEAWGALEYRLEEINRHKGYFENLKNKLEEAKP
jgi:hypothetical protein